MFKMCINIQQPSIAQHAHLQQTVDVLILLLALLLRHGSHGCMHCLFLQSLGDARSGVTVLWIVATASNVLCKLDVLAVLLVAATTTKVCHKTHRHPFTDLGVMYLPD